jgi:RimJ/RimL family protein N-acetyltransferase
VAKRLVLSGERVVLRPYRDDELDEAIQQAQQAIAQVGGMPSREALARRIEQSGRFVDGRLDLAVEAEGRLAGSIQARAPERALPPGVCELGIQLAPDGRGRGYGTEAVGLLARHLLVHGYPRVQASTDVANVAMRRALERAGFVFEGVLRDFMPDGEGRADYALYALTADAPAVSLRR